jgi:bifunctional non-homologous end joining protein LigD
MVAIWPAPMLAHSGRPTGSLTGWTAEFKADGFRCQVAVSSTRRVARTRGGHDIADRLPELEILSHVGVDMILDGELIVGAGRPADFRDLAGAVASKRRDRTRTTFVAFDLLAVDGQLLIHRPHTERRQLLEHLAGLAPEALTTVPSYPAVDVDDLLAACDELDLEGLVLKRRNSVYRPGARSRDWRKVKTTAWRTRHLPTRQASMERRSRPL